MTTITHTPTRPGTMPHCTTEDLVAIAAELGPSLAAAAATHDRDGTWVGPSFELLRERGLLTLAVPAELGGWGATIRDVTMVQRELAHHCASTALASAMHQHVVAFTAWRYRRGMPGAEATLRRVVDDGIVLVSTGGADFTHPRGEARRVEGGYRMSGRKIFASQSPVGDAMSTMFAYDDPERGLRVLNVAIPFADPGVTVCDNWDALGIRGTASNDVIIEDVFVPDEKVMADRPHGVVDGALQAICEIAIPVILGVYVGVAESAATAAIEAARARSGDPLVQRQVGAMWTRMRQAVWALDAALAATGDDPVPAMETVAEVMAAKRAITDAAFEVCGLAVEIGGGAAFARGSVIERAFRDIRGITFHPFKPEQILLHAGRVALGEPADVLGISAG